MAETIKTEDLLKIFLDIKNNYDHWLSPLERTLLLADFGLAVYELLQKEIKYDKKN